MNTSFVKPSNIYSFDKKGVDPDSIINNPKFERDFKIELHFSDVCKKCKPTNQLVLLCEQCRKVMPDEVSEWNCIKNIVDKHMETMRLISGTFENSANKLKGDRRS